MKNKLILIMLTIVLFGLDLSANALSLNIVDKKDGNVDIFVVIPSDKSIGKTTVKFEAIKSGKILFEKKLSSSNKITTSIPNEPYFIVLDAGVKYQIIKKGIKPTLGFTKNIDANANEVLSKLRTKKNDYNKAMIILWSIASILILLTLYFSIRNTNRLIQEIKS